MTLRRFLIAAVLTAVVLCAASTTLPAGARPARTDPGKTSNSDQSSGLIPDSHAGRYPTSHYDIGYDQGAWNNMQRKFFGTLTELAFGTARWLLGVGLWVISWAYRFGIAAALGDLASRIAGIYQTQLIGPVGLRHAGFFYAVAWTGYHGLRGRLTMALGELAVTALVAVAGTIVLANPHGYLQGTFDTTGRLSATFLAVGTGHDTPTDTASADTVLRPLAHHLHAAFIDQPYDVINWGRPLTGACATARDKILADGPHGASDSPRNTMNAAGCHTEAKYNHDPGPERLGGAVLTMAAAAAVVVLLVTIAVTLLVAQVIAVGLFAVAPFALCGGLLPGGGREVLWRWLAALARVMLAVVGMSFVLSLLLLTIDGLLTATGDAPIIERFTLMVLVTVGMLIVRKRIVTSGAHLAERLTQRLAAGRSTRGNAGTWLGPAAAGGISGYALGASLRDSAGDLPGTVGYRLRHAGQRPYYRTRRSQTTRAAPRSTISRPGLNAQSALAHAGQRLAATRPGRVLRGTTRVAAGTAAAAYKSTLGLPVHGPRAYRAAADKITTQHIQAATALRGYRTEYRANLARVRRRSTKP